MFKKVLIIGASRGLGCAIVRFLPEHLGSVESLTCVSRRNSDSVEAKILTLDMSKPLDQEFLGKEIEREKFDLVIYSAGGGPHGEFVKKDWKDHFWALQVGLIAPMYLSLAWLKMRGADPSKNAQGPGRFVIVGSRIAESNPDPLAASYAASKHGLIGFVSSVQGEVSESRSRIWLFSPGYINTPLLPASAPVRHNGVKILSPDTAAQALLRWVKKEDGPWHRVLS